jgi:hypothetical protein
VAAVLLLALSAGLVGLTLAARFIRGELLNTDEYVATVAPLADDPAVQAAIADRLTNEIVARIDVVDLAREFARQAGMPTDGAVTGVLAGSVGDITENSARLRSAQFVRSAQFGTLWRNANRKAHGQLRTTLTGSGSPVSGPSGSGSSVSGPSGSAAAKGGAGMVVDLGPVLDAVKRDIAAHGFIAVNRVPQVPVPVTLLQADQVGGMQWYIRWLDAAAAGLALFALGMFAAGIWIAPRRRVAGLLGCALVVAVLALPLLWNGSIRTCYAARIAARGLSVPAGLVIYDTATSFLRTAIYAVMTAALLGIAGLYLAGPGRLARRVREAVLAGGAQFASDRLPAPAARRSNLPRFGGPRPSERLQAFAARRPAPIAAGIAAVAGWLLLRSPTFGTVGWLALAGSAIVAAVVVMVVLADRSSSSGLAMPGRDPDMDGVAQSRGVPPLNDYEPAAPYSSAEPPSSGQPYPSGEAYSSTDAYSSGQSRPSAEAYSSGQSRPSGQSSPSVPAYPSDDGYPTGPRHSPDAPHSSDTPRHSGESRPARVTADRVGAGAIS